MLNNRVSKYIDQRLTELKGGIDSNRIIIGDFLDRRPVREKKTGARSNTTDK